MVVKRVNGGLQVKARQIIVGVLAIILLSQVTAMAYIAIDEQARRESMVNSL